MQLGRESTRGDSNGRNGQLTKREKKMYVGRAALNDIHMGLS